MSAVMVVLFMLGIVGTFHNMRTKLVVSCISLAGMIFDIKMMLNGIGFVVLIINIDLICLHTAPLMGAFYFIMKKWRDTVNGWCI